LKTIKENLKAEFKKVRKSEKPCLINSFTTENAEKHRGKKYVILSVAEESRRHEAPRSLGYARDDSGNTGAANCLPVAVVFFDFCKRLLFILILSFTSEILCVLCG
jgi:hypothetical protein